MDPAMGPLALIRVMNLVLGLYSPDSTSGDQGKISAPDGTPSRRPDGTPSRRPDGTPSRRPRYIDLGLHELLGDLVPAVLVYRSNSTIGSLFGTPSGTNQNIFGRMKKPNKKSYAWHNKLLRWENLPDVIYFVNWFFLPPHLAHLQESMFLPLEVWVFFTTPAFPVLAPQRKQ